MNIEALMRDHGIERIVHVPASDLLPCECFHAWARGETMHCGRGATIAEAIMNAHQQAEAA